MNTECFRCALVFLFSAGIALCSQAEFTRRFAPHQGIVTNYEHPDRRELCLNGRWQFQPMKIPSGWTADQGIAPALERPQENGWAGVSIKIPSAWNVNNWGLWGQAGKYDPVPLYFPSYPESWKHVQMGWLRKTFSIPADWKGCRIIAHFDAVAGECRVVVNGTTVVNSHYDTFTPFEADITDCVEWSKENELLVGVRAHRLFNKAHPEHQWGWRAMGPNGSDMSDLCGVYQDVFLLAVPPVYVEDVFVKPWLDRDTLEADATVRNASASDCTIEIGGVIRPWKNLAGDDCLSAPEEAWTLEDQVLSFNSETVTIKPGEQKIISLRQTVNGKLNTWDPAHPNLYGLVLTLKRDHKATDRKYVRFGWRQFKLHNGDLFLNGRELRLHGDILHPFSSFIMTRRTAWAWYTMIRNFGGNAVRLHAQPWPKFYLDVADEMGIVVLDEAALFGSAGGFNMDQEQAWENCRAAYQALIQRDRNSPSVLGWSFANEMFALALLNKIPDEAFDRYRARLAELGRAALSLDPTREWISCDGDEDLGGRLPVWSKHWGDGWKDKQKTAYKLPETGDTLSMLGEYSGSYYGTPDRLDYLNGDRAYESYAGRAEALGIDVYELLTGIARERLDYFSASETAWFGLEHLNLGYDDYTRLPNERDGVFFARPYQEGEPGMQPERLPPFVTTLNPGWDSSLPLYKPLAMFEAMKAGLANGTPLPFQSRVPFRPRPPMRSAKFDHVQLIGDRGNKVHALLERIGLPLSEGKACRFFIIDAKTGLADAAENERLRLEVSGGATAVILVEDKETDLDLLNAFLGEPIVLTDRQISSFVHGVEDSVLAPMSLKDLYLVEQNQSSHMMNCGLDGPFIRNSTVLLQACNVDWSLFHAPENRKCGALVLYEKLQKPAGAALVERVCGKGKMYVCSIGVSRTDDRTVSFWKKLFACLGVRTAGLNAPAAPPETVKLHDLLRDGPIN